MPVSIQSQGLDQIITAIGRQLASPDLIVALGSRLAETLEEFAPTASGATARAVGVLGQPGLTDAGWSIGVGSGEYAGSRNEAAPKGTIAEFLHSKSRGGTRHQRTHSFPDAEAWWRLPKNLKDELEQERRWGKFGGQGALYAKYLWNQNYGSVGARIVAQHFLEKALEAWQAEVPGIVEGYLGRA